MKPQAALATALLCATLTQSASALSRRYLSLPKAVAQADAIVVAQPVQILGRRRVNVGPTVQIEVVDVLKGKASKGKLWVQMEKWCGRAGARLSTDRKWIFFLSSSSDLPAWNVMPSGTSSHSLENVAKIKAVLNPKPHS